MAHQTRSKRNDGHVDDTAAGTVEHEDYAPWIASIQCKIKQRESVFIALRTERALTIANQELTNNFGQHCKQINKQDVDEIAGKAEGHLFSMIDEWNGLQLQKLKSEIRSFEDYEKRSTRWWDRTKKKVFGTVFWLTLFQYLYDHIEKEELPATGRGRMPEAACTKQVFLLTVAKLLSADIHHQKKKQPLINRECVVYSEELQLFLFGIDRSITIKDWIHEQNRRNKKEKANEYHHKATEVMKRVKRQIAEILHADHAETAIDVEEEKQEDGEEEKQELENENLANVDNDDDDEIDIDVSTSQPDDQCSAQTNSMLNTMRTAIRCDESLRDLNHNQQQQDMPNLNSNASISSAAHMEMPENSINTLHCAANAANTTNSNMPIRSREENNCGNSSLVDSLLLHSLLAHNSNAAHFSDNNNNVNNNNVNNNNNGSVCRHGQSASILRDTCTHTPQCALVSVPICMVQQALTARPLPLLYEPHAYTHAPCHCFHTHCHLDSHAHCNCHAHADMYRDRTPQSLLVTAPMASNAHNHHSNNNMYNQNHARATGGGQGYACYHAPSRTFSGCQYRYRPF